MSEYVVILTTTDSEEKAKNLAGSIIRDQFAACAQRTRIASTYEWNGEIQEEEEFLILFKTNKKNQKLAMEAISERHTYDEPEIIVLPVTDGSTGYFGWIDSVTS